MPMTGDRLKGAKCVWASIVHGNQELAGGAGCHVKSKQSSTALYITWDEWPGGDTAPVPRSWPGQGAATPGDGTFKLSGMCRFRNR